MPHVRSLVSLRRRTQRAIDCGYVSQPFPCYSPTEYFDLSDDEPEGLDDIERLYSSNWVQLGWADMFEDQTKSSSDDVAALCW